MRERYFLSAAKNNLTNTVWKSSFLVIEEWAKAYCKKGNVLFEFVINEKKKGARE